MWSAVRYFANFCCWIFVCSIRDLKTDFKYFIFINYLLDHYLIKKFFIHTDFKNINIFFSLSLKVRSFYIHFKLLSNFYFVINSFIYMFLWKYYKINYYLLYIQCHKPIWTLITWIINFTRTSITIFVVIIILW